MRKIIISWLILTIGIISFVNGQESNNEAGKWDNVDLDSPRLEQLEVSEMVSLINHFLAFKKPSLDWFGRATWILYNVKSEKVRECYVMWAMQKGLEQQGYGYGSVNDVLEDIRLCSKSETLNVQAKTLVGRYHRIRGERKAEAPAFELESLQGKNVRLTDMQGKFVFMFVWNGEGATEELQAIRTISTKYKDSTNVCCLAVTVLPVEKKSVWENFVRQERTSGRLVHLFAGGDSSFVQDYCITELPRCILIDQDGKIVNAWGLSPKDNAFPFYLDRVINRLELVPISGNE